MTQMLRTLVVVLALAEAGWMAFDGYRALIVGDFVTPGSGPYKGQLGAWRYVAEAVGIPPRSTAIKAIFAVYGSMWLVILAAYIAGATWSWGAMLVAAIGALWFLPFGTMLSVLQIACLIALRKS